MSSATNVLQSSVQIVHLGAVNGLHNHSTYAVRGKVLFDFRDETGNLRLIRLNSLHLPASPDASATAIDVLLHGRWQCACAAIRKDNLLQIECAHVETSQDPEVNSVQLALKDPIPASECVTLPKLYILSADMRPMSSLSYGNLSEGMVRSTTSLSQPTPSPRNRSARVSIGESPREYSYTPIAELWARTESSTAVPSRGEKVNFYGVVMDCRAPCTTRGPDLRCEVVVADESSLLTGELKTMAIYCFEKNPSDCIPFRSVGDVIRAHRIHVGRYNDPVTGSSTVQGVGRFYSTFLLWSHEGSDFLPIASRDPVPVPTSGRSGNQAITHMVTSQDRDKITLLRNWASAYLFRRHRVERPYLRSVLEVKGAHPSAEFLTKSFDLLCCVERNAPTEVSEGNLKLIVSDGLFGLEEGGQLMRVESEHTLEQLEHDPSSQFLEFCPSWEGRPHGTSEWLLIRDITIRTEGSERIGVLTVGRKTSTMVWHPPNSPEVRHVRVKHRRTKSTIPPGIPIVSRPGQDINSGREVARIGTVADGDRFDLNAVKRSKQADDSRREPDSTGPTVTVCKHPNQTAKMSTISGIRKAVSEKKFHPHCLRARARSCSVPRDLRLICRPWCASCKKFMKIDTDHQLIECLRCGHKVRGNEKPDMQWAYCVCLILEDTSGRRLDAWIEGDEGSVFFRGIPPVNLLRNVETRRKLMKVFQGLLGPNCVLDCCVVPYEYEDSLGLYRIACKVFATEITRNVARNHTGG